MNEEKIMEAKAYKDLLEEIKQLEEEISESGFGLEDITEEAREYLSALEAIKAIEGKVKKNE